MDFVRGWGSRVTMWIAVGEVDKSGGGGVVVDK